MNNFKGTKDDAVSIFINPETFDPIYLNLQDVATLSIEKYNRHKFFLDGSLHNIVEYDIDRNDFLETKCKEIIEAINTSLNGTSILSYTNIVLTNVVKIKNLSLNNALDRSNNCIRLTSNSKYIVNYKIQSSLKEQPDLTLYIGNDYFDDTSLIDNEIKKLIDLETEIFEKELDARNNQREDEELLFVKNIIEKYGSLEKVNELIKNKLKD